MTVALGALRTSVSTLSGVNSFLMVAGAGLLSFILVAALTPLVIRLAHAWGWVAEPADDRWHAKATALMGGIGISVGVALTVVVFVELNGHLLLLAAAVVMFITGFVDDRMGLPPVAKLILQLVAASLVVFSGWRFEFGGGEVLSAGITVFWVLGITNAANLVDNMDGLCAGIAGIAALSLAAMALMAGAGALAAVALAVAGAAGGFLLYNFKPAKIFMGDCGSLFLGFVLATLAVMVQAELGMRGIPAVGMTALVLGVPILDTVLVTVVRSLHDRPISQGGRDHTSHRLVRSGLSEKRAVLLLYGLSAVFALLAPVFYASDVRLRVSLTIFTFIGAVIFAVQIGTLEVYEKTDEKPQGRRSWISAALMFPRLLLGPAWKPALAIITDMLIVGGGFVLAHHLRFESALTASQERFLLVSLPVVVGVSIPLFAAFGFYRAIWRHAGAYDVARVVVAVAIASLVSYVGLAFLHGFGSVSRGVAVIQWMAVTLGILFSRFGFRGLRSYLSALSSTGRPVAVYGANEEGAELIRMLRLNAEGLWPVAIIGDASEYNGQYLQGIRVYSDSREIRSLLESDRISELVVSAEAVATTDRTRIVDLCWSLGVACRTVTIECRRYDRHSAQMGGRLERP